MNTRQTEKTKKKKEGKSPEIIQVIQVFGGGMDSEYVTNLSVVSPKDVFPEKFFPPSYQQNDRLYKINFLVFNYGQKAFLKEVKALYDLVDSLEKRGYSKNIGIIRVIDLKGISQIAEASSHIVGSKSSKIGKSVMLKKLEELHNQENSKGKEVDIKKVEVANVNKKSHYVPLRNLIFLSIASAWAEVIGARYIIHGLIEEAFVRIPDLLPDMVTAFNRVLQVTSVLENKPIVLYPLLHKSKRDIVLDGSRVGCDFKTSWSCFEEGEKHCGKCSSCILRMRAFILAGLEDPTEYKDVSYMKVIRDFVLSKTRKKKKKNK